MAVQVSVEGGRYAGVARADVGRWAQAMLVAVQMANRELSILLTDDNQMQGLNKLYRGKNRTTDVLSFAQAEGLHGDRAGDLLGDVVVSVPTARRQAAARGVPVTTEVTMLIAHGILHLLGWDHDTPAKDRRMRRETQRLVEAAEAATRGRARVRAPATRVKGASGRMPIAIRRR